MSDCRFCGGRGEYETDLHTQPEHTLWPNPRWEPWEPDTAACPVCGGTGTENGEAA